MTFPAGLRVAADASLKIFAPAPPGAGGRGLNVLARTAACIQPQPLNPTASTAVPEGCVLLGGFPQRIIKLTTTGTAALERWLDGEPVNNDDAPLARRLINASLLHPVPTETPFTPSDLTIIVPVYDDLDGLKNLLDLSLKVVVVDDASTTHIEVAKPHKLVTREVNGGPAAARNTGLAEVKTPLVAFVDSDATITKETLLSLSAHFADPAVAAVAPRVQENNTSPLDMGAEPSLVGHGKRVTHVPAAVLLARTDAAQQINGFDESLRYGEDVDFVLRIVNAGHQVRYDPSQHATHRPRPNWTSRFNQHRSYGTAAAPLAKRHTITAFRGPTLTVTAWGLAALGCKRLAVLLGVVDLIRNLERIRKASDGVVPISDAAQVAVKSQLNTGIHLAKATTRTWLPFTLPLLRRPKWLLALLTPHLIEHRHRLRDVGRGVADDIAYCIGVWQGIIKERSLKALRLELTGLKNSGSEPNSEGRGRGN